MLIARALRFLLVAPVVVSVTPAMAAPPPSADRFIVASEPATLALRGRLSLAAELGTARHSPHSARAASPPARLCCGLSLASAIPGYGAIRRTS
jgi:hypothetical protein